VSRADFRCGISHTTNTADGASPPRVKVRSLSQLRRRVICALPCAGDVVVTTTALTHLLLDCALHQLRADEAAKLRLISHHPFIEIDRYGERLIGCLDCNAWGRPGDATLPMQLLEDDLEVFRASRVDLWAGSRASSGAIFLCGSIASTAQPSRLLMDGSNSAASITYFQEKRLVA